VPITLEIALTILVAEGMPSDDDGLSPFGNGPSYNLNYYQFTENYTAKDIADGAIWRLQHLLESELLNTTLIGCVGCK
jgi:hypothetical protein